MSELRTDRLILRRWRDADLDPFAAICADPEVMRFVQGPRPRDVVEQNLAALDAHFDEHGFGLWAVQVVASGELIGFSGLAIPTWLDPDTSQVEVGWRLARSAWGHGYATEAGRAAIRHAFVDLDLAEIICIIHPDNERSLAVAARLGLRSPRHAAHPESNAPLLIFSLTSAELAAT